MQQVNLHQADNIVYKQATLKAIITLKKHIIINLVSKHVMCSLHCEDFRDTYNIYVRVKTSKLYL